MARHYIEEIRTLQPHGPYYLLGYSFGGTMVLEMAHQLRAAGEQVALIGMIDSKTRDYQESAEAVRSVQDRINHRLNRFRGNTGELDWGQRLRYVQEKVSTRAIRYACMLAVRLKLTQVPSFMRSAWDINLVAYKNYKLQPFDGRLVLFRASHQDQPDAPHDLGWSSIFLKGVEIHDLPGDHERIFLEPNIDKLAASLRECLTRV
jgi:thioesterase domain-containing protein